MPTDYTTYFSSQQNATQATQGYASYTDLQQPAQTRSFDWVYFVSTQPDSFVPATMTSYKSREDARAARRVLAAATPDSRYYIVRFAASALDTLMARVS